MARLFHPALGDEIDVPASDSVLQVLAKSGWELAPDPEPIPGHEPDPVTYEPVTKKRTRSADKGTTD